MTKEPTYRPAPDGYSLSLTPPRAPSPLTTCAGGIQGASRRILDVVKPAINGRLLASGVAWGNTEYRRRWR